MATWMPDYSIIIDDKVLSEYTQYYFETHKRARKPPIKRPHHPSINTWMIMPRPQMNGEKQKWKDFIMWVVSHLGYTDLKLSSYELYVIVYMPTKRRSDPDNQSPKFILDGLVESGMLIDDDGEHMKKLSISTRYDKDNPRTELLFWDLTKHSS